jgi:hypothetical protein
MWQVFEGGDAEDGPQFVVAAVGKGRKKILFIKIWAIVK